MTIQSGARLGHYEILASVGAGGMGEVWRAKDMRLGRDVAIKVLPSDVAEDAERLARFEREARLLAALNHPSIAQVYGFENAPLADGSAVHFLAMELVEGEDLAERLKRGPLPVDEALAVAKQIADALEQAHQKGIVHRDLKPANVKLEPDGKVKVLDFGLAKAYAGESAIGASGDLSNSPTLAHAGTQAGVILGTAAYMSPEQARGKPVDQRADIWAFGVVLFEMLSGRRLFAGETVSDMLAAVLRAEPDWNALPAGTPPRLRALVRRCLERDPRRRLRDIGEARIALEDLLAGGDDGAAGLAEASAAPVRRRAWGWLLAVAGAALIGAVLGRLAMAPARPHSRLVRFEISAGAAASAAISPDGLQVVIASRGRLWVRDLARLETREIAGTEGAVRPFWSPDSRTIAYGAHGKLWRVLAEAGSPTAVCDLVSGLWDDDAGGAWMADGTIVYSNGNAGLWRVPAQGGDPVQLLAPDPQRELHFHTANALPDGRSVVYVVHRAGEGAGTDTLGLWSDGRARVLFQSAGQSLDEPAYSPSGHILFRRSPTNAGVWALPFSLARLEATGEAFPVSPGTRGPSVASDGTLVLLPPRRTRPVNLAWADRAGKILGRIDEPRLRARTAAISPGGDRVAVTEVSEGKSDIWLYDLRRGTRVRLTTDGGAGSPSWLPDGRELLYQSQAASGQGRAIKRVLADGSGRVQEIGPGMSPAASHDGRFVFYTLADKDGLRLWYRSLTNAKEKPALFLDQAFYSVAAAPSPDGRFVAYQAESAPDLSEVYLRRFPPAEGVWQVSSNGGVWPHWSRDGRLFFAQGADVFEVAVIDGPEVRLGTPTRLFRRAASAGAEAPAAFDVSPDGTRFLTYEPTGDATDERIVVVLNWFAELDKPR
jgi:Tol biopolymer transport system component